VTSETEDIIEIIFPLSRLMTLSRESQQPYNQLLAFIKIIKTV